MPGVAPSRKRTRDELSPNQSTSFSAPAFKTFKPLLPVASTSAAVSVMPCPSPALPGDSRTRGMFIAFCDRAFASLYKVCGSSRFLRSPSCWLQGDRTAYSELVGQFKSTSTSSQAEQKLWFEALSNTVNKINKAQHSLLIDTILAIPWATAFTQDSTARAYIRFVSTLVAAKPEWLKAVVEKIVKGFRWSACCAFPDCWHLICQHRFRYCAHVR